MSARRGESLLIRGGHLIDPAQRIDGDFDVLLRDGRVADVQPKGKLKGADENFDARGLIVAPGFIDLHVHLREPGHTHKETIATGTTAAAAGGFTSVCAMPNTVPVNDSPEITRWMLASERGAVVNVFPIAAVTVGSAGEKLANLPDLHRAGAIAFSDDGRPVFDEALMREALRFAAHLRAPVIQHAEDTRLTEGGVMNAGATAFRLGLRGMPAEAESRMIERDIVFTKHAGAHLHVAHISTAESLKAVRRGKKDRTNVTCEVTPHHFILTEADIRNYDTRFKMNPPLRTAADREALLAGLADGSIDAIASDHAPHAPWEKEVEFDKSMFGITGLETAVALALGDLTKRGIPLRRIVELFSTNPARIARLSGRGTLAKGSFADVTIFDPKKRWTFDPSRSRSKSRNTPFKDWPMHGKVMATIVGGKIVYQS